MIDHVFLVFLIIAIVLCLLYLLLMGSYCLAWLLTKEKVSVSEKTIFVSIIIAARNEENYIIGCLDSICKQLYDHSKFEVIIVDDHSIDSTKERVQNYRSKHPSIKLFILSSSDERFGKKRAIQLGVNKARGELVITTDADCRVGKNWLSSIVNFYIRTGAKMIVGPVCYYNEKNSFEKMQSLEFMALLFCGGASLYFNKAIMCNGANLAYPKKVFSEVNGYSGISEKASGDDVLLMYKIKNKYPKEVCFLKQREAIVYTTAMPNLKGFINQRKRWASKKISTLNTETKLVASIIYLFNFFILFLPLMGSIFLTHNAFFFFFMRACLALLVIKCSIDFLLLFLSASFFKKKRLLIYFVPEQIVYLIYIVLFGLIGTMGPYEWKGRKVY